MNLWFYILNQEVHEFNGKFSHVHSKSQPRVIKNQLGRETVPSKNKVDVTGLARYAEIKMFVNQQKK